MFVLENKYTVKGRKGATGIAGDPVIKGDQGPIGNLGPDWGAGSPGDKGVQGDFGDYPIGIKVKFFFIFFILH